MGNQSGSIFSSKFWLWEMWKNLKKVFKKEVNTVTVFTWTLIFH